MKRLNLRVIALFKVFRGSAALSLAIGFWLGAAQEIQMLESFPDWLREVTQDQLLELALLFLVLSIIRFSEALGIWFNQTWAQWLAVITGLLSIGFFTYKLLNHFDWMTLAIGIVNLVIVVYLLRVLKTKNKRQLFITE